MKLRYLHLSDLHLTYSEKQGDNWAVDAFNQDVVTDSMLTKISELVNNGENFDFIIISGDIAKRGKREEYKVAEIFCKELMKATGLNPGRLFLVPGNHDVNRNAIKKRHIRSLYHFKNQEEITEILTEPETFGIILRKFMEFNDFAAGAMGRRMFDEKNYYMVESLSIEKQGTEFKVNVMGLNSAIFAGYDGDDKQKLALGLYQVDRALKQLDKSAILSMGFFHHPFSCLHPSESVSRNLLMQRLDLILTGHLHEPLNAVIRNAAGRALVLGAGASFESRESQNSFNSVEIDLTNGKGRVQFYKYLHKYDRWKKDTDVNPDQDDGHFPFIIDAIRENPLGPKLTEPQAAPVIIKTEDTNYIKPDNEILEKKTDAVPPVTEIKKTIKKNIGLILAKNRLKCFHSVLKRTIGVDKEGGDETGQLVDRLLRMELNEAIMQLQLAVVECIEDLRDAGSDMNTIILTWNDCVTVLGWLVLTGVKDEWACKAALDLAGKGLDLMIPVETEVGVEIAVSRLNEVKAKFNLDAGSLHISAAARIQSEKWQIESGWCLDEKVLTVKKQLWKQLNRLDQSKEVVVPDEKLTRDLKQILRIRRRMGENYYMVVNLPDKAYPDLEQEVYRKLVEDLQIMDIFYLGAAGEEGFAIVAETELQTQIREFLLTKPK